MGDSDGNKKLSSVDIIKFVQQQMKAELNAAIQAASASKQAATDSELQAKSKYETQGIEAGYLAGAQAKRVSEIKSDLLKLENFKFEVIHNDTVTCGQVIILQCDGKLEQYFLLPISGRGYVFTQGDQKIHVISDQSPIGREILGLNVSEVVEVQKAGSAVEYEIKAIQVFS